MYIQKLEDHLCNLIKLDTCQPSGNEKKVIDYIVSGLQKIAPSLDYDIIDHGANRASLCFEIEGEKSEKIALIGHVDTVETGDLAQWTQDPFSGLTTEDDIFGRGACDMKSGVSVMLTIAEYFLLNELRPDYSLIFCFTADEERDGYGARAIVEREILSDAEVLIIPEPTNNHIAVAEKGALWLEILVRGRQAHASLPSEGTNAIEIAYELFTYISEYLASKNKQILAQSGCGENTVAITKMFGGIGTNIIAPEATMILDIRTVPGLDHVEILECIKKKKADLISFYKNLKIDVHVLNNRPAVAGEKKHPVLESLAKRLNTSEQEYLCMPYYTDASQVVPSLNRDCTLIIFGPGDPRLAHKINEFVSREKLSACFNTLLEVLLSPVNN